MPSPRRRALFILASLAGAALLGIPLGCFSAIRRNSLLDRVTAVLSVAFIAIIADRILRGYANSLGTTDIRD